MSTVKTYICEEAGQRLDVFLAEVGEMTRSAAQKMIDAGLVQVNGKTASKNTKLKAGDTVCAEIQEAVPYEAVAQDIPIKVVYEDEHLLVVNKPKGMVVHPAAGNPDGTLVNALMHHCGDSLSGINGVLRPGIVHRIDKDTSGLLVVAKTNEAHLALAEAVKVHNFTRIYETVVYGNVKEDSGTINLPIARHPVDRKKMAVAAPTVKSARNAVTHYEVKARYNGFTWLRVRLETGRTHQIRVHMSYKGHPVAGDPVYGPKKVITSLNGQCLHAGTLGFVHPITGEYLEFCEPLPEYFTSFIKTLEKKSE
ncbi:MAG: RluA family pseudouridine synthase [Oscillospiraceae bacterium]|nr:RluA family pseudouridine synthase [Oscillospiraceae bacterium]